MKYLKIQLALLLLLSIPAVHAQDEMQTLFTGIENHGGYGGPQVRYMQAGNLGGVAIGGGGGWVINHSLTIGGHGLGFFTQSAASNISAFPFDYNLVGGYGGFLIETMLFPKFPVNISIPILIGSGAITYQQDVFGYSSVSSPHNNSPTLAEDEFFVLEPGLQIQLNISRHFRIAFGAHYRYTSPVRLRTNIDATYINLTDSDILHGIDYSLSFKFGAF